MKRPVPVERVQAVAASHFTLRITADGGIVANEVEDVGNYANEKLIDDACELSYYHYFCIVIHHAYNDAKIVK